MPKITQVHKQVAIRSGSDYSLALLARDLLLNATLYAVIV
jgi:hypothetical protein